MSHHAHTRPSAPVSPYRDHLQREHESRRAAVVGPAARYEAARSDSRLSPYFPGPELRASLRDAERALVAAIRLQGGRVALVGGVRYRIDAVGELERAVVPAAKRHTNATPHADRAAAEKVEYRDPTLRKGGRPRR